MKRSPNGGIGFFGLLLLLLIGLKLGKVITCSWFWVLFPVWAGGIFTFLLVILV